MNNDNHEGVLIPDEFVPDYSMSEEEFRQELEQRSIELQEIIEKISK